ncbi:hypothetical protein [Geobacter pickeringii]|uniref:Pyridoxamine 5'-phosphate oxidase putative domain-containing protein n=1 Tax=Geobacter pickeringii TaxID=345632 RepID=A0A0B5BC72_9BACT|nr:hypothetical protein [Geobacter pickeringii]AJE02150.1 hypothetical protein GPICK_01025 [Geobacter pickeringii]
MAIPLTADILELLDAPATIGTIATLDEADAPYAVPSPFLRRDEEGRLVHLELLETSPTHRNLVRSIWFDRPVTVTLSRRGGRTVVIRGRPWRAVVSGPLFSGYYRELREQLGDADLAAVWLIKPETIVDETYAARKTREEELHPFFIHLDRLAVTPT